MNDFEEFTKIIDRLTYMLEDDKQISYLMTETLCHILIKSSLVHFEDLQRNLNMDTAINDKLKQLIIENLTKKLIDYLKFEGEKDDRK